ncbi:MAG: iron chaperone [Phycisphaerales bacterium JB065]
MPTKPATVQDYLAALPDDRREALEAVRKVILKNLPKGYEEGIQYNMIGYFVPHSLYPDGYHCDPKQPLLFASIASQKNHMGLYLFCVYCDPQGKERFVREWKATGKKLDMGASCVRFKKLEDVPLEVLGAAIKRTPVKDFIAFYEANIPASKRKPSAKKKTAKKKTAKKR